MKKAILFEPTLLAEVERKSPELYAYYCKTPMFLYEYVDYGTKEFPMYIPKVMMDQIEPMKKYKDLNIQGIILALQAGYICGNQDLINMHPGKNTKMLESAYVMREVVNICLKYPYYTIVDLLNPDYYDYRSGIPYSKWTYKEAQYFVAWNTIFDRYEDWNYFFIQLNNMRKKGEWSENDEDMEWGFPDFN